MANGQGHPAMPVSYWRDGSGAERVLGIEGTRPFQHRPRLGLAELLLGPPGQPQPLEEALAAGIVEGVGRPQSAQAVEITDCQPGPALLPLAQVGGRLDAPAQERIGRDEARAENLLRRVKAGSTDVVA